MWNFTSSHPSTLEQMTVDLSGVHHDVSTVLLAFDTSIGAESPNMSPLLVVIVKPLVAVPFFPSFVRIEGIVLVATTFCFEKTTTDRLLLVVLVYLKFNYQHYWLA